MAISVNYDSEGVADCVPTFLFDYVEEDKDNPHDACQQWFVCAALGLSVNLGLHTLLGKGEHPIADGIVNQQEYLDLPKHFSCSHFDAIDIVQLAIASGARYVEFPAKLEDGFCLFDTESTDYNSRHSEVKRDLIAEIASVCEYHNIGLCLTYSLGYDFGKYPATGRPATDGEKAEYDEYCVMQLHELLTNYGPLAAIKFNGIDGISREQAKDLYKMCRHLQPQILVCCQQGLLGTEDFYAPGTAMPAEDSPASVQGYVYKDASKPLELRLDMTPNNRGYHAEFAGKHLRSAQMLEALTQARRNQMNLLLNTALLPDGSLDLEDIEELLRK